MTFSQLISADWSTSPKKRWSVSAQRDGNRWRISAPVQVTDVGHLLERLFDPSHKTLAGFDFPIGMPAAYGQKTGFSGFLSALDALGSNQWKSFFDVADTQEQISIHRPFYPRVSRKGSSPSHVLTALGLPSITQLRRQCEQPTQTRQAACPLFWTLGGNQVGKAAISGWRELVKPAQQRGAKLWPFAGSLAALERSGDPIIAEIYPGEAYSHLGLNMRGKSKRKQADRVECSSVITAWAAAHGVALSDEMQAIVEDGFGSRPNGEDMFDAAIGLCGMIEVVDGRRDEGHGMDVNWEGWIFGQCT
jgi:hypothetical protein